MINSSVIRINFIYIIIFLLSLSCRDAKEKNKTSEGKSIKIENKTKPAGSFSDTLKIVSEAAVFYYPDSLQLEKIKAVTEKNIFDGSMHEYFYQIRYAHNVLEKYWPGIKIIEARNVRYLQFIKSDETIEYIDLDTKNDAYGLFVFDPMKKPIQLELTNAESEIGLYFSTSKPLKRNKK